MKVLNKNKTSKSVGSTSPATKTKTNHDLDKYDNVVLFPEKVAKAREILSEINWDKFKELSSGKKNKISLQS